MSLWLARRKLVTGDGVSVEVLVSQPEITHHGAAKCVLRFVIGDAVDDSEIHGIDAFQCISLALYRTWVRVEALGCKGDGWGGPREHGFARVVGPQAPLFDVERLHRVLDEEERLADDEFNRRMSKVPSEVPDSEERDLSIENQDKYTR